MRNLQTIGAALALSVAAFVAACETSPAPPPPPTSNIDPLGNVFTYAPAGQLEPGSGAGRADNTLYLSGIRFPLESAPAYLNSQVYNPGGSEGGGGGQCDPSNYAYPWRDNFCETRTWDVLMCPTGHGHQGQDIRPATCVKSTHWAVAAENGQITSIGSYTVTLVGNSGTIYRYMHMNMGALAVSGGQNVVRGQRIGKISNDFGGSPTTIHLHFDVKQNVVVNGSPVITYVPPYASLVDAYIRLINGTP